MGRKHLTQCEKAAICDAYKNGEKVEAIMAEYNICQKTLYRLRKQYNVTARISGRPKSASVLSL